MELTFPIMPRAVHGCVSGRSSLSPKNVESVLEPEIFSCGNLRGAKDNSFPVHLSLRILAPLAEDRR